MFYDTLTVSRGPIKETQELLLPITQGKLGSALLWPFCIFSALAMSGILYEGQTQGRLWAQGRAFHLGSNFPNIVLTNPGVAEMQIPIL